MNKITDNISIVLPVFNEEAGILDTIDVLENFITNQLPRYELIFVDDGSQDTSVQLIQQAQENYDNIRLVQFSRNFGHQLAITAGIRYATGDAVVVMDADLQDPPAVIPEMIDKWHDGYDVVYGKRLSRDGESWFKKVTAKAFYRILHAMTSVDMPVDTGDFRLMDKKVVAELKTMDETEPFVRGMVSWVGFKQTDVSYERQERNAGVTKYPLKKMLRLATDGLTSFSDLPLKLTNWLGGLAIAIGFGYGLVSLFTGFSTLQFAVTAMFLLTGLIMVSLGIIGVYLYRMFESSRQRPLYIVARTTGFPSNRAVTPRQATMTFQQPTLQRHAN